MTQTAVEWLQEKYNKNINIMSGDFEQAKAMEKGQIMEAYLSGDADAVDNPLITAKQYYNETYGKE